MEILADSNILGRFVDRQDLSHPEVVAVLDILRKAKHTVVLVPQNLYEFCSFATRPKDVRGLGMSGSEYQTGVRDILRLFKLRFPDPELELEHFRQLHLQLAVTGKKVHDLRLVAACKALGIGSILTFNDADFRSASAAGHIQVMTPAQVLAPPASSP